MHKKSGEQYFRRLWSMWTFERPSMRLTTLLVTSITQQIECIPRIGSRWYHSRLVTLIHYVEIIQIEL